MLKVCQRCENPFDCYADLIENCFCSQLQLHKATQDYLKKTSYDCLCASCLLLVDKACLEAQQEIDTQTKNWVEGKHYYYEGTSLVMTEYYHILKGFCCRQGCRHCAYGFTKTGKN